MELEHWGGDDMGSGTDEDDSDGDMEEEPFVSPPPSEDVIERQIRDEFAQWKQRTRQRADLQDQDCHFIPWSGVGHCLPYNPRETFVAKEGLLKRIRPERQDRVEDRVTSIKSHVQTPTHSLDSVTQIVVKSTFPVVVFLLEI